MKQDVYYRRFGSPGIQAIALSTGFYRRLLEQYGSIEPEQPRLFDDSMQVIKKTEPMQKERLQTSLRKTARTFINLLPIIIGMLLLTSLAVTVFPENISADLFGGSDALGALIGASVGSVAAGHPLTSYLLGGEFLKSGVSLVAVTALIVSWVTVGIVQLPAEALMLGTRFAIYRNVICFFSAVAIAFLSVYTLRLMG